MKKLSIQLILVLIVCGFVIPHWLKGPDGKPVMSLSDWLPDLSVLSGLVDKIPSRSTAADSQLGEEKQFYKWQDEEGGWHYSDKAPDTALKVEKQALPQMTNTIKAVEVTERKTGSTPAIGSKMASPLQLPEGVSKEALEQMLEDAHRTRMGDQL